MRDDDFEWDRAKAAANLARHGVSFEAARLAFSDAFAIALKTRAKITVRTASSYWEWPIACCCT